MLKNITISIVALSLVFITSPVGAQPPVFQSAQLETDGTSRTLVLPAAAEGARFISLGTAVDPATGRQVEGIAIFHHRDGHNGGPGGGGPPGGGESSCFAHISKGAGWNSAEPWRMDPSNNAGLNEATIFALEAASLVKWEVAADGTEIFGTGELATSTLVADTASPDGNNEVYFADVSSPGAIAVTIVWGIFRGPPSGRELVEWDQVYDDVDFDWSTDGVSTTTMDFDNIATHENGHSAGMAHPDSTCTLETMYAFAGLGEIIKRDLHDGDITGILDLY